MLQKGWKQRYPPKYGPGTSDRYILDQLTARDCGIELCIVYQSWKICIHIQVHRKLNIILYRLYDLMTVICLFERDE